MCHWNAQILESTEEDLHMTASSPHMWPDKDKVTVEVVDEVWDGIVVVRIQ